jgi:hypothetical protein
MFLRRAACKGAFYFTDQSATSHGPHDYFPNEGPPLQCNGWTAAEARAEAVTGELRAAPAGSVLEAHPGLLMDITRLVMPSAPDDMAGLPPGPLTRLFGVRLEAADLPPGGFRFRPFPGGEEPPHVAVAP